MLRGSSRDKRPPPASCRTGSGGHGAGGSGGASGTGGGAGGCTGRYVLQDGLLTLFWDDWAPEALEKNGSGFSRGPFSLTPAVGSRQLPFPESVS